MKKVKFGYEVKKSYYDDIGEQFVFEFKNGYGASVITYGYGSEDGLYELAVLKHGEICYDTEITDDVLGYLNPSDIKPILDKIACLGLALKHEYSIVEINGIEYRGIKNAYFKTLKSPAEAADYLGTIFYLSEKEKKAISRMDIKSIREFIFSFKDNFVRKEAY